MKHFLALFLALLGIQAAQAITVDEVPNVHVFNRSRYVSNPSGVLSPDAEASLNAEIGRLWADTSVELAVVAVDEIDSSMDADEFATKLFGKWGIGKKDNDNGVLLLLSRDDEMAVIRTGYGVEGVLPDIVAGRIIRNVMSPLFRRGEIDSCVIAGVEKIDAVVRDPSVAEELMSAKANDAAEDDFDGEAAFQAYLALCVIISFIMLGFVISVIMKTRGMDDAPRWDKLHDWRLASIIVAVITLGIGIVPMALLLWKMHRVRRHKRNCPHCGTRMQLIDEEHDNDYLSRAQDMEERFNSVDYDVWHCPKCAQTDIIPYVNEASTYKECPNCHARTLRTIERRVLRQPTTRQEGLGADFRACANCNYHDRKDFRIPKESDDGAAAAAVLGSILASGGGRGGGGGGFSGGSFGGGMTGGGGASGHL